MPRTRNQTVKWTTNYAMFEMADGNRAVHMDNAKRKRLVQSMERYGFLPAYPIYVCRQGGRMVVQDGQHRLTAARGLGVPVYYIEIPHPIDIPRIQSTQAPWTIRDYAESHANAGNRDYQELLTFAEIHDIPIGTARDILGNRTVKRGGEDTLKFNHGAWRVTSREHAERVVGLLAAIVEVAPQCRSRFLISALFAYSLVEGLDDKRLTAHLRSKRELARRYGSRDGYLDMLEKIYNFRSSQAVPIRVYAENMLRKRGARKAA